MGLIATALRPTNLSSPPFMALPGVATGLIPQGTFEQFARNGYMGNEIVFAAIDLLATSVAEPEIIGKRWRRAKPEARRLAGALTAKGVPAAVVNQTLVTNGYYEEVPDHPLVTLLNNPNPYKSRFEFWASVLVDYYLAGNVFLLKARASAPFDKIPNNVMELWRLRPDRVKIIPGNMAAGGKFIEAYEYTAPGGQPQRFPPEDIVHFKTRNPLDDYYGMPPLLAASGRIAIDRYMRDFLRRFYETGGTGPGAVLTVENKMSQEDKDVVRDRFKKQFGGPMGWFEMMILDNTKSTYQQLGLNRGLRDALPKEIDAMNEARISMVLHVPAGILGLLIGMETSSYANQRQAWQVLWDVTLRPVYSDLDSVLNLSLVPDFTGIDEVCFDLSQIYALQEDVDKLHDRARKNLQAGGWTLEEFRDATGFDGLPKEGMFLLPSNYVATPIERLGDAPEPAPAPQLSAAALMIEAPRRARTEDDPEARALWEEGEDLRKRYPSMTYEQIAARLSISDRTYRRYRDVFSD